MTHTLLSKADKEERKAKELDLLRMGLAEVYDSISNLSEKDYIQVVTLMTRITYAQHLERKGK